MEESEKDIRPILAAGDINGFYFEIRKDHMLLSAKIQIKESANWFETPEYYTSLGQAFEDIHRITKGLDHHEMP